MRIDRCNNAYVAWDDDRIVWTIDLHWTGERATGTPFREELVWPAAGVVAIGGGDAIHFVAMDSGVLVNTVVLDGGDDLFGGLELDDGVLYVLGFCNVIAIDGELAVRWISKDIAVDGIVWRERIGDRILLSAEQDPPGGWIDVELDAATGRRL